MKYIRQPDFIEVFVFRKTNGFSEFVEQLRFDFSSSIFLEL